MKESPYFLRRGHPQPVLFDEGNRPIIPMAVGSKRFSDNPVDAIAEFEIVPVVRKDFPETWLWETINPDGFVQTICIGGHLDVELSTSDRFHMI